MSRKLYKNQNGFTIIELAIASLVFSTVLLLITFGLLRVGRAFTKSVNTSKTQEVSRAIIEDISQSIQFSGDDVTPSISGPNGSQGFCIGNRRYSYVLDRRVGDPLPGGTVHGFVVDTASSCNGSSASQDLLGAVDGTEFMGQGMSLDAFDISQVPGRENFWTINVRVIFGDPAIDLGAPDAEGKRSCLSGSGTSEYCAVSDLTTTVQKRIE